MTTPRDDIAGLSERLRDRAHAIQMAEASAVMLEAATQLDALQEKVKEADEACQRLCRDHGFATGHGDRVADMIDEISAQIRKIIYVPGSWHCPKCKFTLLQSNLNAQDGTVTARDTSGDKCPNCDGPLWRCTWKNDAFEMQERAVEQMERAKAAECRATRAEQERDEALERLKPFAAYTVKAIMLSEQFDYCVHVCCSADEQPQFKHFSAARDLVRRLAGPEKIAAANDGEDSPREGKI